MSEQPKKKEPPTFSVAQMFGMGGAKLGPLVALAQSEIASGKYELALETLGVLTDLDPHHTVAWGLLAEAHRRQGNHDSAAACAEFAKGLVE